MNAAVLAMEILSLCDNQIKDKMQTYKSSLSNKIVKANEELKTKQFKNRVC